MKNSRVALFFCALSGLMLIRCSPKNEVYNSDKLSDYVNPVPGSFIIYRLDSTKFSYNNLAVDTVISYQAMDVVDAAITDNLGRPSWRVIRYLNDTLAQGTWVPNSTYMITPSGTTLEVIENNFRYQKLKLPIKNGYTWKGNSFIDTQNPDPSWLYNFMDDWDYTYANYGTSFTPLTTPVPNTVTVNQRDEILGTPGNPDAYNERNLAWEVYGKGIGLVYKIFLHRIYQPRSTEHPDGYYDGWGIELKMISHN
jgi:hypothetical protein